MVNRDAHVAAETRTGMGKVGIYALVGVTVASLMTATGVVTYVLVRPSEAPAPQAWAQPYPPQYQPQPQPYPQAYQQQPQLQTPQALPPYQAPQYQAQPQFQPPAPFQPAQQQASNQPVPMNPQLQSSARDILVIVSKLDGFTDESGRNEANANLPPIQVFFDPRCPYCHKLYDTIAGKAPIHWIPISALSPPDGGVASGAAIIQAEKDRPGVGGKEAMRAALDKTLPPFNPTDAHKSALEQNLGSFALMAKTLPPTVQAGVPFALIPKQDGTFETHVGYSEGDENVIVSAYGK